MEGNGMREKVDGMQQGAAGQTWTLGHCSEDTASVHGSHALPTELLGCPRGAFLLIRRSIDLMSTSAPRQFLAEVVWHVPDVESGLVSHSWTYFHTSFVTVPALEKGAQ